MRTSLVFTILSAFAQFNVFLVEFYHLFVIISIIFLCISICFVQLIFWNMQKEISLSDTNAKISPFFYQNFPNREFATALQSCTCNRYINKCKYLIFVKLKKINQLKRFLTNFAKNWKGFLRSMDTEASNIQIRLHILVTFRNWYFIAKIGIRNWYFSTIFNCF